MRWERQITIKCTLTLQREWKYIWTVIIRGLSPVKFDKVAGRHEITLRRDGYESKTYSIYLENDKKDETFSFSELEKITIVGRQVPSEIISAVSGIANCTLKEGTDVNFDRERKIATLTGSGKNAIVTAVQKRYR